MNKKNTEHNDEINLAEIIIAFWKKKTVIILIILVSVIIGIGVDIADENKKDLYEGSLYLDKSSNSEFSMFYPINKYMSKYDIKHKKKEIYSEIDNSFLTINGTTSLTRFIDEFYYKEVLLNELQKINYIKKEISNFAEYDKQIKLSNYAKSFNIYPTLPNDTTKYKIIFQWPNPEEGKKILIGVLDQISKKIFQKVIDDIEKSILITKSVEEIEDFQKLKFLNEQLDIAIALDIEEVDDRILLLNKAASNTFSDYLDYDKEISYFLKGKKAIKKEIEIIKNRDYSEFKQIEKYLENIKNKDQRIKWVNYNPYLIEIREIEKSNSYLQLMLILGLVLAFLYGIVSYTLNEKNKIKD